MNEQRLIDASCVDSFGRKIPSELQLEGDK